VLDHGVDLDRIASSFGLEPDLLRQVISAVRSLPAGILREHGDTPDQGGPMLEMPAGDMQTGMVVRTVDNLVRPCFDDKGKISHGAMRRMVAVVSDVADAWISDSYLEMRYENLPDAKRWLWFLDQLALKDGVMISHVPSIGDRMGSPQMQMEYWRKGLGFDEKQKDRIRSSKGRHSCVAKGVVRITVDLNKVSRKQCSFTKPKGLFGVRFALALVRVIGLPFLLKRSDL
jgi:DNA-binding IscR family transcriptional regulator